MEGLLRWLVIGAVSWYATQDLKRNAPLKVKEFSKRYFEEQDRLASFIREHCVLGDDKLMPTSMFLSKYNEWARDNGACAMDKRKLAENMREKGFTIATKRIHDMTPRCFLGIDIDDVQEE